MSNVNLNRRDDDSATGPIRLPRENYKLRIIEEPVYKLSKQKPGKPQYPMLVFKMEVVEPQSGIVDGKEVTFAGVELTSWAVIFQNDDGTENSPTLASIHRQGNLPMEFMRDENSGLPVDDNGVPISYAGIVLDAKCSSEEYTETNEEGVPLKNPITGEVLKGFNYRVNRIY